jgi:nitroimidazol reductase NimA-like FMN-containing flavoprotein (pyridoxamine 5'-phosphate oxidase superfamily)
MIWLSSASSFSWFWAKYYYTFDKTCQHFIAWSIPSPSSSLLSGKRIGEGMKYGISLSFFRPVLPLQIGSAAGIFFRDFAMRLVENEKEGVKMHHKIKDIVKGKDTCVLATVSGSTPHCSLMSYVTDDECREIYMVSHKQTKKFQNVMKNPAVSLLIDTREEVVGSRRSNVKALTVNGMFQKIEEGPKKDFVRARFLEKHPHLKEFTHDPDAEIFSVRVESFLLLEGPVNAYFERVD